MKVIAVASPLGKLEDPNSYDQDITFKLGEFVVHWTSHSDRGRPGAEPLELRDTTACSHGWLEVNMTPYSQWKSLQLRADPQHPNELALTDPDGTGLGHAVGLVRSKDTHQQQANCADILENRLAEARRPSGPSEAAKIQQIIYPKNYKLPAYDGDLFRWIGPGYVETQDGRVFKLDSYSHDGTYYELPALRGIEAIEPNASCAVWPRGIVKCWSRYNFGEAGPNCALKASCPEPLVITLPDSAIKVKKVGTISEGYCALLSTGQVYCWGSGPRSDRTPEDAPRCDKTPLSVECRVPRLIHVPEARDLGVGGQLCVVTKAGKLYCLQASSDVMTLEQEIQQDGNQGVISLEYDGTNYSLISAFAITTQGKVYTWGQNHFGELGDEDIRVPMATRPLVGLGNVKQIVPGGCALEEGGTVACWGRYTRYNSTKAGMIMPSLLQIKGPIHVPGITGAVQIGTLGALACARFGDGRVYCWGRRLSTEFGENEQREFVPPMPLRATTLQQALVPK